MLSSLPAASFVATAMVCGGHAVAVGAGGAPLLPVLPSHPPARVIGGCATTIRSWYRTDGGRRATAKIPATPPALLLLRALRPEAAAHEKAPFQGAFCVLWQKTYGADRRISSAGKGGESAGQRKEKPCSSALSPCRCLGTSLALRLTHLRLGALSFPARQRQGPSSATGRNIFGGRGRKPPFSKGLLPLPP